MSPKILDCIFLTNFTTTWCNLLHLPKKMVDFLSRIMALSLHWMQYIRSYYPSWLVIFRNILEDFHITFPLKWFIQSKLHIFDGLSFSFLVIHVSIKLIWEFIHIFQLCVQISLWFIQFNLSFKAHALNSARFSKSAIYVSTLALQCGNMIFRSYSFFSYIL